MHEQPKQYHAYHNPVLAALVQVSRAAEFVNQQMDIALADLQITNVQYNILRILKRSPENGISRTDIKRQLIAQSIDLTRSINGLVNSGYVVRITTEQDRRIVLHQITEKGVEAITKIDPLLNEMLQQIGAKMTPEEWLQLNGLCLKMLD
ncbi:MAG: MarR family winged helix-turn-helix transcriptional regulator [Bacteroidia bacterium]